MILLWNIRVEIGLKLIMLLTSRVLFFKRGFTRAVLKAIGKQPDCRQTLIICNSSAEIQLKTVLKNLLGIGSRGQVVGLREDTSIYCIKI